MNSPVDLRFADGKDAGALRTIGEVAKALGIAPHVLRYWEQQFPMLKPVKRSGGRRYYRAADIDLISTIDRLVNREGYTLKGAKKALASGVAEEIEAPELTAADLLPRLRVLREQLASALDA
ncbi:MerR family transcriptional regulator [Croceicoccus estronivorus]|uniref:MerR family transcriptional regulator n=1 Tax=Croceicoccus estronivorus TaxID=1172626 RepID=UPI00082CC8EC|nr:MerR family transcriptional regulator [Croceicoccus estronivorus]OCC22725.1 MerR family transcriptional regulator [Croceicoccus estronivorus]